MIRFRVATYNVHKCRGMDWRVNLPRIASVLSDMDADAVAVQEVFASQALRMAEILQMQQVFGAARSIAGEQYGNAVFTRLAVATTEEYDLTVDAREPRACLRVELNLQPNCSFQFFAVHLGTSFFERRHQADKLVSREVLERDDVKGARIVAGDFNEWTRGHATNLLSRHLRSADLAVHLRRSVTYPGLLPFLKLDHIYYDPGFTLSRMHLHRTRTSLAASDHLPLIAEFTTHRDYQS